MASDPTTNLDALVVGLRKRHVMAADEEWPVPYCTRCEGDWPCDATQAADALDALRTERDAARSYAEDVIARVDAITGRRADGPATVTVVESIAALKAERDAAQARVRALVAALRMVEGEFDHLDGEGFEDQPNAECPLCVIRAALTAPDAALVARERARDAVVEGTAAFLRARAAYVRSVTPGRIGGYGALLDAQQKALAELERRVAALDALAAPERGDG